MGTNSRVLRNLVHRPFDLYAVRWKRAPRLGASVAQEDYVSARSTNARRRRPDRSTLVHAAIREPLGGRDCGRHRLGGGYGLGRSLCDSRLALDLLGLGQPRTGKIRFLGRYSVVVGLSWRIAGRILVLQRRGIQSQTSSQGCQTHSVSDKYGPKVSLVKPTRKQKVASPFILSGPPAGGVLDPCKVHLRRSPLHRRN